MATAQQPPNGDVFLVWRMDEPELDGYPSVGYWAAYTSLRDALDGEGDGAFVYRAKPEYMGRFKKVVDVKVVDYSEGTPRGL